MKQGMARIYVLLYRIETIKGLVINLDSPATDALGGGGLPGEAETRFWHWFGGAILLSFARRGKRAGLAWRREGPNQNNFNGTLSVTKSERRRVSEWMINPPRGAFMLLASSTFRESTMLPLNGCIDAVDRAASRNLQHGQHGSRSQVFSKIPEPISNREHEVGTGRAPHVTDFIDAQRLLKPLAAPTA
jgi:hypothetical protein